MPIHPGHEDGDHCPHLECDKDDPKGEAVDRLPPTKDHDDDAVYFTASVMLACKHGEVSQENLGTFLPVEGVVRSRPVAQASSSQRAHPPPLLLHPHCPLYLRTLTLLL
jgi:hypothetical protein